MFKLYPSINCQNLKLTLTQVESDKVIRRTTTVKKVFPLWSLPLHKVLKLIIPLYITHVKLGVAAIREGADAFAAKQGYNAWLVKVYHSLKLCGTELFYKAFGTFSLPSYVAHVQQQLLDIWRRGACCPHAHGYSLTSCSPVDRVLVYQPGGPGSIPGMSRSESPITRGKTQMMVLPPTTFSWTSCLCANLLAGSLARDCH